jgi:hypothetical protein
MKTRMFFSLLLAASLFFDCLDCLHIEFNLWHLRSNPSFTPRACSDFDSHSFAFPRFHLLPVVFFLPKSKNPKPRPKMIMLNATQSK